LLDEVDGPAFSKSAPPTAAKAPAIGSGFETAIPNSYPTSAPDPTAGLPVPGFQEPPLWFKPPAEPVWQEVKHDPNRVSPSSSILGGAEQGQGRPTLSGPQTPEPGPVVQDEPRYGVERGYYYYTDEFGEVILYRLAGFGRRLAGAVIDAVITEILAIIVLYIIIISFFATSFDLEGFQNLILALAILPTFLSFFYHTFLVGLTNQTLGHRIMGLKVIKRRVRAVGLLSGIIRALYGTIPALVSAVVTLTFPAKTAGNNYLIAGINLAIYGLFALGMAWALVDKAHQGLHDKLADTYVVRSIQA
jgi:uncharacterized RDD family membrane protein YckC